MTLIDHVSVGVGDLERARAFYAAVLGTLGMREIADRGTRIGFGKRYPEVWINSRPGMPPVPAETGVHVCLRAKGEAVVQAFYEAALANGGSGDGAPGPRVATMTSYFAAFVRDPDGNRLEAAAFPAAARE